MQEEDFIKNFLAPSENRLDPRFRFPLPPIPGLAKESDYIIQCETGDTYSINIIGIYRSEATDTNLKETYKNTQNRVTGAFVRLVGSMTLVVPGYPRSVSDVAIMNVDPITGAAASLTTKMMIHLPQATAKQYDYFYSEMQRLSATASIPYLERSNERLPDFWGKFCSSQSVGINLDMIRRLRDITWEAYRAMMQQTDSLESFDYQPFIDHMVSKTSDREHDLFAQMGMSVPKEAQAAFFSVQI